MAAEEQRVSIYVDVSSAVHGKAGLKRYAENLVRGLCPLLGDRLRLFHNSLGRRGPLPGFEEWPTSGVRWGYKPWRSLVAMGQWLRQPMNGLVPGATLFHATEHLLPPLRGIPTVLTVHDLIFERLPQHHKLLNRAYLGATMPMFCRRASAIIAVSEATKCDLVALYGLDPARIIVIPEAADPRFRPQPTESVERVKERYGLPPRYVLAVGTIEPRKNLSRLVDACGRLMEEDLIDGLVLVGGLGWLYEEFLHHVEESPWRERVIRPGFVPDEDLPAVYAGAIVTAQPSLYEGFGLPVLEAMASGSPVCASATSSLPEVGGDAALYFDPEDTEAMAATLRAVATDPDLRADMARRGIARASGFSWERTARETLALYERVIAEGMA
jgi:glycosyltransferase involved in cell wall biosynthesis